MGCAEHARLKSEYIKARDVLMRSREAADMRDRIWSGQLNREERELADRMAMAIARLKEHVAEHGCERRK